jgi:hypothetical protein
MPQVLRANNIPFHCIKQSPGEYVITFPGAYHMMMNAGQNWVEAVIFCMSQWRHFVPDIVCTCTKDCSVVRSKLKSHSVELPSKQEYAGKKLESKTVTEVALPTHLAK